MFFLIKLSVFCQNNNEVKDEFSFKEHDPIDFLEYLKLNNNLHSYGVDKDSIPEGWIDEKVLPDLILRIESMKPTLAVYSINASIFHLQKIYSSEGVEAIFLIEGYRKNIYPPSLGSYEYGVIKNNIIYPDEKKIKEIKKWWEEFQKK